MSVVQELVVRLAVVVLFLVIGVAFFFCSGGVEGAGIPVVFEVGRDAIPGLIGGFVAGEEVEAQQAVFPHMCPRKVVGVEIGTCAVYVPIGADARQASVESEVALQHTGTKFYVALPGAE